MAAILKSVQDPTISPYSPWLEDIYKLEKVDVKSIRKFEQPLSATLNKANRQDFDEVEFDLKLDLGASFNDSIAPYIFDEPIHVLNLSKQVEKFLLDHDVTTIKHLQESPYIKNERPALGQAFLNEIQNKLRDYLKNFKTQKTDRIDFLSLIRASIGALDRKKLYVALEPHGLHEWIQISLAEKNDLKKLSEGVRSEWQAAVKENLLNHNYFKNALKQIFEIWGFSWMQKREGFATGEELVEFLILRSEDEEVAIALFEWVKADLVWKSILENEGNLFFHSKETKKNIHSLYVELLSYFPTNQFYEFEELAHIIQIEHCKRWKKLEITTIFHLLERLNDFKLVRREDGKWLVNLSAARHFLQYKHHKHHTALD